MKSSQLIKQGRYDEALTEINSILHHFSHAMQGITTDNDVPPSPSHQAEGYYLRGQLNERKGEF